MIGGKPIIGIIGGIGSGKSFVAGLFAELGAAVVNADELVHHIYERPDVLNQLREWWGDSIIDSAGKLDRAAVAKVVFNDPSQRKRLEDFVHPLVHADRALFDAKAAANPRVTAIIWDIPLLVEIDLHRQCDAVVCVEASREIREKRVIRRGWDVNELDRRENLQLPLDTKRKIADYCISNGEDVSAARSQVREVFSRIIAKLNKPLD